MLVRPSIFNHMSHLPLPYPYLVLSVLLLQEARAQTEAAERHAATQRVASERELTQALQHIKAMDAITQG